MIYDQENNVLCWEISRGAISNTVELGNFIIHVSASGTPILVEILNASKFVGQLNKIKLNKLENIKQILPAN